MATKKEIELLSKFGMAYFNFDEPTGNYADQLGKGSVGVANNTIRKTSEGYGLTVGSNGANQNVNFGSSFSSKFNNPFTLKFRIKAKPSTNVNGSYFLGNYYASSVADRTFSIRSSNTGELDFIDVISGVASNKITVQGVLDDKWHEIIYTRNSSSISVFVDYDLKGTVETKDLLTTNISHSFYLLNIPAFITSERNLNGEIDELQVYNKDLYPDDFVSNRFLLKSNNKTYSLKSSSGGRNEILTSNIGTTAIASSSSDYATNRQAWRAFDGKAGNDNERWITSSGAPQWLKYSLKNQPKVLEKYAVYSAGSRQPTAWTLEASNDNINWTVLDKVSGLSDVTDYSLLYEKTLNLNKSYLHYRLYITSALSSGYVELGEFELYFKTSLEVFELKEPSESNFINYGTSVIDNFNLINTNKNYILQDTVSKDTDGLWKQDLNRKPLSIKFE